jgi:hypothetical protein
MSEWYDEIFEDFDEEEEIPDAVLRLAASAARRASRFNPPTTRISGVEAEESGIEGAAFAKSKRSVGRSRDSSGSRH